MTDQDRRRAALARHQLTEVLSAPRVACSHEGPVRIFKLAEPGTRMMSVDLIFAAGRIWISGDLQVNQWRGVVSDLGYGLPWFAGELNPGYLAEKFLRKRHVPALAVAGVREAAERYFEDRLAEGEEPSEEDRQVKAALEEAAELGEDGPCRSSEGVSELYGDLGVDASDGVPGWGYDPEEEGWLSAVQQRFAELYADIGSTSIRDQPGTFDASGGREGE